MDLKILPAAPPVSRRAFLAGCSGLACAVCNAFPLSGAPAPASAGYPGIPKVKPKVRLVFAHPEPSIEGWPYKGYNYEARKTEILNRLRAACPATELIPVTVQTAEDAAPVIAADAEVDGYVVYLLGIPDRGSPPITRLNRPIITVNDFYGGGLGLRQGPRLVALSTSDFNDIAQAVRTFETLARLRKSTLIDVTERDHASLANAIQETTGVNVRIVPGRDINAAYDSVRGADHERYANDWAAKAGKIVEPSREEIGRSARMYSAMLAMMRQHSAQAIAVDCLHLFYAGKLAAYPCLGFCQMNDDGFVGACEADIRSAVTMLAMSYLVERPGYISDPVMDTSKNQVIYAHCVAPTKAYGPNGPASPYEIRDHSEDRKGAALRALLPLGETVTTLIILPPEKKILYHMGKTVENLDDDKACRTKLVADVQDATRLFEGWTAGWHRVTVYGDHRKPLRTLAGLLGYKLVQEG
jgi:hypothetical protein